MADGENKEIGIPEGLSNLDRFLAIVENIENFQFVPTPWFWTRESMCNYRISRLDKIMFYMSGESCMMSLQAIYYFGIPLDDQGSYLGESDFVNLMGLFPSEYDGTMVESVRNRNFVGTEYKMEEIATFDELMDWVNDKMEIAMSRVFRQDDGFKNAFSMLKMEPSPNKKFTKDQVIDFSEFYGIYHDALRNRISKRYHMQNCIKAVSMNLQKYEEKLHKMFELDGEDPLREAAKILALIGADLTLFEEIELSLLYHNIKFHFRGPVVTIEDLYNLFFLIKNRIYSIVYCDKILEYVEFMGTSYCLFLEANPEKFDKKAVFIAWLFYGF